ncbi:hypothetical protein D1007_50968 [Hordeum vulgare]|nr:hypothetical protein D1007_50968 [Hordeum vulgare]
MRPCHTRIYAPAATAWIRPESQRTGTAGGDRRLTGWRRWRRKLPRRRRMWSRRACRRRRRPASRGRRSAGPLGSAGARRPRGGRTPPTWTCRTSRTSPGSTSSRSLARSTALLLLLLLALRWRSMDGVRGLKTTRCLRYLWTGGRSARRHWPAFLFSL